MPHTSCSAPCIPPAGVAQLPLLLPLLLLLLLLL
eukprot:COSAG01_NODE_34029_length_554_cov_12.224176_1_plen_33_part_10